MSRESSLWQWLKKAERELGPNLHMNRIENSAGQGQGDVEGHLRGSGQFWIELKTTTRPVRPETKIRFKVRPKQIAWHTARAKAGGRSYFLLQVGSGADRRLYLVRGRLAAKIAQGMTESELAAQSENFGDATSADFLKLATHESMAANDDDDSL